MQDSLMTNFRYLAAYNELVARISQRQQSLILFVAIFSGLMTSLLALKDWLRIEPQHFEWFMVGFPFASIALTMLNLKYEKLISILRAYLAELEQVGDAHLQLPSLNSDPGRMKQANGARYFHDLTCAMMILSYNGVAFSIYHGIQAGPDQIWVESILVLSTIACVGVHLAMGRYHYQVR